MGISQNDGLAKYLLLFNTIYLSCSFVVANNIVLSFIVITAWLLTSMTTIYILLKENASISFALDGPLVIGFLLIICIWITDICNNENLIVTSKNSFAILTISLIACLFEFDSFRAIYIDILSKIANITIVLFGMYRLFPMLSQLNIVRNLNGFPYSCLYIY